jgi:hypothetical protein
MAALPPLLPHCRDYAADGFSRHVGGVSDFCGPVQDDESRISCAEGQIAIRISFGRRHPTFRNSEWQGIIPGIIPQFGTQQSCTSMVGPCCCITSCLCAANFVFFTLHALFLAGVRRTSDPRAVLHCSGWLWKLIVWAGCLVGFFFVPNSAIIGYAQVCEQSCTCHPTPTAAWSADQVPVAWVPA